MLENNFLTKLLDGQKVEWKSLGEVVMLRRGRVMSKSYLTENSGNYPVYSSQTANNGMIGKINSFDFDGEFISWTTDGANAGTVFYRTGKFSITNVCGLITINDEASLDYKFLFYWLSIEAKKHVYSGMGNPKLMSHQVEKIPVPIPCPENPAKSLEIQQKIVTILDKFTQLTTQLTTELAAELQNRKKQYSYYRDKLLTFNDDEVEWKSLAEVCLSITAGGDLPKNCVKGQLLPSKEYPYPIFANATDMHGLYGYSDSFKIESEAVTISARGAKIGFHTTRESKFTPIIRLITLVPNKEIILNRYLNYILDLTPIGGTTGGIPQLTVPTVKKIKIPIPPLSHQKKIVTILDKFDSLTNSISEGLPREIELRQKQYEYYRDLLLNFPKEEQ
jgi:type I restriction enzyme S subunit